MFSRQKRFYAAMLRVPKPAKRRARKKEMLRYATGRSALGAVVVALSVDGIVAVLIRDRAADLVAALQQHFPTCDLRKDDDAARGMLARVLAFIDKPSRKHALPLDLRGTLFQRRVWEAVQAIPAGELATYSAIAEKIKSPKAVRAVGSTCTKCPISLLIPCHRVVHKGAVTIEQAAQGSTRKRAFLLWDKKKRRA